MIRSHTLISPKISQSKCKVVIDNVTHMCLLYVLLHLLCACEHTKIYADPPVEEEEAIEASVSLGFCQDDSDCQHGAVYKVNVKMVSVNPCEQMLSYLQQLYGKKRV